VLASYNAAPHNRYQPHPEEPEQYTKCSNTVFVLLKMVIMKNVETEVNNKHPIVASCWFFYLSSHFAHDALSQEHKRQTVQSYKNSTRHETTFLRDNE
jgi:hypothetical protein